MNAKEVVAHFSRLGPQDPCFYPQYLGEHFFELRLRTGYRLHTPDDMQMFLLELSEACRTPVFLNNELLQPESAPVLEMRTGPKFTKTLVDICHDCGHEHETDECCGEDMGNRVCTCRKAVRV